MLTATYVVIAFGAAYLVTGTAVGLVFIMGPIARCEPAARGSYAFRVLLLPGLALFWPLVLQRWHAAPRLDRSVDHGLWHARAWLTVVVVIAMVMAAALAQRGSTPREPTSIRIGAASGFLT